MAQLNGTISDPSGAAIPNARVILQGTEEKSSRQTVTGSVAEYVIPAINPGKYQLRVEAPGLPTRTTTDMVLGASQASRFNVDMKLGQAIASVNVKAVLLLLQSSKATSGSEVSPEEFVALPLAGRDFTALITILPAAGSILDQQNNNSSVAGVAISPPLYGQWQRDNNFTLNAYDNDQFSYTTPFYPPPEAITQMRVGSGVDSGAYSWSAVGPLVAVALWFAGRGAGVSETLVDARPPLPRRAGEESSALDSAPSATPTQLVPSPRDNLQWPHREFQGPAEVNSEECARRFC